MRHFIHGSNTIDDIMCIGAALSLRLGGEKLNVPIRVGQIPTPTFSQSFPEWLTWRIFVPELWVDSFLWNDK